MLLIKLFVIKLCILTETFSSSLNLNQYGRNNTSLIKEIKPEILKIEVSDLKSWNKSQKFDLAIINKKPLKNHVKPVNNKKFLKRKEDGNNKTHHNIHNKNYTIDIEEAEEIFESDINQIKRYNCFYINENLGVWDLNRLDHDEPTVILTESSSISIKFCADNIMKNECQHYEFNSSYVVWRDSGENKCKIISGNDSNQKNITYFSQSEKNSSGIIIDFPKGEFCNKTTKERYSLQMKLICDKDLSPNYIFPISKSIKFEINNCVNTIEAKSYDACGLENYFPFLKFMDKYNVPLGIIVMIVGLLIAVLGNKELEKIFILIGGITFSQLGLFVYQKIHGENININYIWLILGISFVIGALISFFISKQYKLIIMGFGAFLGYTISFLIYSFLKKYFINSQNPEHIFVFNLISWTLLGSITALILQEEILLVSTSLIGSYVIVRGLSYFTNKLPDPKKILEKLKHNKFNEISKLVSSISWNFVAVWIFIFIICLYIQFKFNNKTKEQSKNLSEKKNEAEIKQS